MLFQLLQNLLSFNCKQVNVIDSCKDLLIGVEAIKTHNPDLVEIGYHDSTELNINTLFAHTPTVPLNIEEPEAEDLVVTTAAPSFFILNSQITKTFGTSLDFYLGVENIANFRQNNPILSAENPFGEYFDGSLVWGPIFGRMTYF